MAQSDSEIISEILGLTEQLRALAVQESQIRDQIERLAGLLATAVELRNAGNVRADKPAEKSRP